MSFLFSQPAPGVLPNDSVSFSELVNINANSVLGNPTALATDGSSISFIDLTQDHLSLFSSTEQGVVPASGGGTTNFLRADGTWVAAGVSTAGALDQQVLAYDSGTGLTTWQYAGLGDGSFGTGNVVLGTSKGAITSGTANTIIGVSAATLLSTGSNCIAIGNTARLASDATDSIVIGNTTGSTISGGANYNITIGKEAGSYASGGIAGNTVVVGHEACRNSAPDKATCVGNFAGRNATGNGDTFIGYAAGYSGSGGRNTIVGHQAGQSAGLYASVLGYQAASANNQNYVTAIGYGAAGNANGIGNVAVAMESLYNAVGNNNIGIGYQAGYDITGNQSICLGVWAGSRATAGKELYIANTSSRLASNALEKTNSLVYGQFNDAPASQTLTANAQVTATYGISVSTAGYGLSIKSGANAKIGKATITSPNSSVTVNTTAVTANSVIFLTGQNGTDAFSVNNIVPYTGPGTGSFDIVHGGAISATIAWMIVEATP